MSKILFIDVETGGLDATKQSILTLGACIWPFEPGSFNTCIEIPICEDDIAVEQEAMDVNRIDLEKLRKQGLSPACAVNRFEGWLYQHFDMDEVYRDRKAGITLGGYNVGQLDLPMLKRLYRVAHRENLFSEIYAHRVVDLASIARFLKDTGKISCEPKSTLVFEHFKCTPTIPHTALHDAIAAASCYEKMLQVISPPSTATFGERYARFCGVIDGPHDLSTRSIPTGLFGHPQAHHIDLNKIRKRSPIDEIDES